MYSLTKDYKIHSEHNFLLFLSLLLISLTFYTVIKSSKYITISPEVSPQMRVQEKTVSIVIVPAPAVRKQEVKIIKPKVVKQKPIKKIIKKVIPVKTQPIAEPIVEPLKEAIIEPVIQKTPLPVVIKQEVKQKPIPVVPVFDAQLKASFIAGLYEILNKKKYYPKMAKRRKLEGTVEVSFTLCKDGTLRDIFLHKSCGHKILDKAALKVVKSIDIYRAIPDAVSIVSLNLNIPIRYSRN